MKLYQRSAAHDICPLFIDNDTLTARRYPAPEQAAWTGTRPAAQHLTGGPILNGALLTGTQTYGTETHPTPAPAPFTGPMGVEAVKADLGVKSERARDDANRAARDEVLRPHPDPQVLRRYSGGGGLGESINAFYTPRAVADTMIAACGTMTGTPKQPLTILDPACGPGTLLSRAPAGSLLVGVELEADSARIASTLLPHASIVQDSFEAFHLACVDPLYTHALVNPPYGPRSMRHLDQPDLATNEAYFLLNTLRRVRHHDGLMVALVNLNLFGGESHRALRQDLALHGELLHTVVVPEGAFRDAGAGVTTCIATFRRYDLGVTEALTTLNAKERETLLGDLGQDTFVDGRRVYTRTGDGDTLKYTLHRPYDEASRLADGRDLTPGRFQQPTYPGDVHDTPERRAKIREEVDEARKGGGVTLIQVLGMISHHFGKAAEERAHAAAQTASSVAVPFGTRSPDGTWVRTATGWVPCDDFARPEVADALQVAVTLSAYLVSRQEAGATVRSGTGHRLLQTQHRAYLQRHGRYDRARLLRLAPRFPALALLIANLGEHDALQTPEPQQADLHLTGSTEEIAAALADLLLLDEDTLTRHARIPRAEAETFLYRHYCFNGETWLPAGLYYTGNAVLRAAQARIDARLHGGVRGAALQQQAEEFLRRLQTPDLTGAVISPRDPVVPLAVLEAWVNTYLGTADTTGRHVMSVVREHGAVKFMLRAPNNQTAQLNARKMFDERAARDLQAFLNHNTRLAIIHGASEMSRDEYRAERAAAMEEARDYEERVTTNFTSWLHASGYADETLAAYVQARHAHLTPHGITDPLPLKDWQGPSLHPYQAMDVRALATVTGGILGYDVGLGKTLAGLALVAYLRLIGRTVRPCIVVPSGLVSNWAMNAALALPNLRVVTIGMTPETNADGTPRYKVKPDGSVMVDERGTPIPKWREDTAAKKKLKLAQVALGQADLVIMSRDTFTDLPMTAENRDRFIRTDLQYIKRLESQDTFDPRGRKPRHDTLKRITAFQSASQARLRQNHGSDLLFEHLALDLLVYDEMHAYKNLYAAPSAFGETPKFLGGGGESNRALDACHKGRFVRERGGRTYGLTASWVKNSPLEVHSMLSLVTDDLPDYGLDTNEVLMDQYLDVQPRIVTNLEGDVDVKAAVVAFKRLIELKAIIDSKVIIRRPGEPEVVTRDGQPLHVPRIVEREVTFDMHPEQAALYDTYRQQIRAAGRNARGDDHAFSVMWRMRKLTADPALVDLDCRNPRFDAIATEALRVRAQGGKTLVFLSIGEKEGAYTRLRDTLIRAGYPESEIEIVTAKSHGSSVARQNLEDNYNYGHLTLLICSDVVAEGFNLQHGTRAILHGDIPWNYEGIRQRNGRGGRQGNTAEHVESIYLLQRGSFDTITYTIVRGKKGWQDQLDGKTDTAENTAAEFSADEIALLMSDNPDATKARIAEKKAELAERTGRAALRRRINAVYRAYTARQAVRHTIDVADRRKNGWTARDYLRVAEGRRGYERERRDLDDPATFPLARLAQYRGVLTWEYGLPMHAGLTFTVSNVRYEVLSFTHNEAQVRYHEAGRLQSRTLPLRTIREQGSDFHPVDVDHQYDTRSLLEGVPLFHVIVPPNLPVQVFHGKRVNPAPRTDGVISVAVRGGEVESVTGHSEQAMRRHIDHGQTLIHYLTQERRDGVQVTSVVVLCPTDEIRTRTEAVKGSAQFGRHLKEIVQQAVNF